MAYTIIIKPSAHKEPEKIQKDARQKLIDSINSLAENSRPSGCKKLINFDNHYRVRNGIYRVIYGISDTQLIVEVIKIGNRKDVYR